MKHAPLPSSDLYPRRLGRKALLLPILSFLLFSFIPVLYGSLPEWTVELCVAVLGLTLLASIPFAAWVARKSWRSDPRQFRQGLGGCALGVALSAFTLFALHQIRLKAEATQKALEASQATDFQSLPAR